MTTTRRTACGDAPPCLQANVEGRPLAVPLSSEGDRLIAALHDARRYPHPAGQVELIETHISWVLLAGEYAYKIKKPVNLGFLDFSSLEARRFFCNEELRLNRRTAPELYLEVLAITGSIEDPRVGGTGAAIEYAVKMRCFAQEALADRAAKSGSLGGDQVDSIAAALVAFHAAISIATSESEFGAPEHVAAPALENFDQIESLVGNPEDVVQLERLRAWSVNEHSRLRDTFADRKQGGFVRECHGDLHLGNVALLDGRAVLFDCLEFNAELRWIDVMNEVAFLVMDLLDHRLDAAASRFLNAYLEATGDYAGARVLRYYLVYRALVRAKVACMRARQAGVDEPARLKLEREYRAYLSLAQSLAASVRPALVLMHGLSGSGKTTIAQAMLERIGAIRVRSDVERKRLHGIAASERTHAAPYDGIYAPETTRLTYDRLKQAVRDIIESGRTAIVDAAFLWRAERDAFLSLARELKAPFLIVSCRASEAELRRRVARREAAMNDASEAGIAVLENQLATQESLGLDELERTVLIDSEGDEQGLRSKVDEIAAHFT